MRDPEFDPYWNPNGADSADLVEMRYREVAGLEPRHHGPDSGLHHRELLLDRDGIPRPCQQLTGAEALIVLQRQLSEIEFEHEAEL